MIFNIVFLENWYWAHFLFLFIQMYHILISFISKSIFTQRILSTELWDTNERWASAWARWERSFPRRPSSVCRRWTWRGGWCRADPPPCPLQQLQHDTSRTSHLCSVDPVMLSIETLEFLFRVQNKKQCWAMRLSPIEWSISEKNHLVVFCVTKAWSDL